MHLCMTGGRAGATALGLEIAREVMHAAGRSDIVTGLRTKTHMGQPDWETMLGGDRDAARARGGRRVLLRAARARREGRPVCARLGMRFREERF